MRTEPFRSVRILDNFYQTSAFFPMPVVLVCTIAESGQMNLGRKVLTEGQPRFPPPPIEYGFRNNAHFWFRRWTR